MENSYSWDSRTPRVSGREICRHDTIWVIYIWLTFLEEVKKRTHRMRQMLLPWYPANRDTVFIKERRIRPRLAIERHHVHSHLNTSHLQKRQKSLHPGGNTSDIPRCIIRGKSNLHVVLPVQTLIGSAVSIPRQSRGL